LTVSATPPLFLSVSLRFSLSLFSFSRTRPHQNLHSFPTRRSSDLKVSIEDEKEILAQQESATQKAISMAEDEKASIQEEKRRQAEAEKRRKAAAKQRETQAKQSSAASSAPEPKSSTKATPSSGGSGQFTWPAAGTQSSGYGHRWGKLHAGIDIANATGTPIKAAAPGVVISTNTPNDGMMNGYGNVVLVAHSMNGKTYTTLYGHMNSISVSAGQKVTTDTEIGKLGSTGQSTGPHLHFEIHEGGWNA